MFNVNISPIPLLCIAALFVVTLGEEAAALVLVDEGESEYRIVVAEDAVPTVTAAAELLRDSVRDVTGAELPIERRPGDAELDTKERLIVLGDSPWARAHGCDPAGLDSEGYAVKTVNQTLFIAGVDSDGDPFATNQEVHAGTYVGTARIIERTLGIRWYLPGELWTVTPQKRSVKLDPVDERVEPTFRTRRYGGIGFYTKDPDRKRGNTRVKQFMEWHRRNGGGSGLRGRPSHDVKDAMAPYVENDTYTGKPEWMALVNGERLIPTTPAHFSNWYRFHVCTSSEEVREIFVDYVLREFKADPDKDVVGISMTDGDRYCQCDDCRAQDAPGTDSKTDRYMNFFNHVAREVAETYPDKLVGTYIYAGYVEPPVMEKNRDIADNLLLTIVQNGTMYFTPKDEERSLELVADWGKLHDKLVFYSWPVNHGFLGLPVNNPDWMVKHLQALHEYGYWGYNALFYGNLISRQPDIFLWDRLMYDIDADPKALLDRFYDDLYGPAAGDVRRYFEVIAEQVRKVNSEIEFERDRYDDTLIGYEGRVVDYYGPIVQEMGETIEAALASVEGQQPYRDRVHVLRMNFAMTEAMVEAIRLGQKQDAQPLTDDERERLDNARERYHRILTRWGNTDVMDIDDIQYVPVKYRADLSRYLLLPRDISRWFSVPYEERPASQREDLSFRYEPPTEALAAERVVELPERWAFRPEPEGEAADWATADAGGEGWKTVSTHRAWTQQGIDHRGAGWYRLTLDEPPAVADGAEAVYLLFPGVDGRARVYLDGELVGQQAGPPAEMWDRPWAVEVTDTWPRKGPLELAVRVEKQDPKGQIGIWKPIELRQRRP